MHCEYIPNSLRWLILILCMPIIYGVNTYSQTNIMLTGVTSSSALEGSQYFNASRDIKAYFSQQGIPAELKELLGRTESYCFVTAHPYSGLDTTDLYCFVKQGERWRMFLKAFLWKTHRKEDVEFRVHGDLVEVVRKGVVVLAINPPK